MYSNQRENRMVCISAEPVAQYHSKQAMVAARKMRITKRRDVKRRTGQMVCHHLKMMLSESGTSGMMRVARTPVIGDGNWRQGDPVNEYSQIQLSF